MLKRKAMMRRRFSALPMPSRVPWPWLGATPHLGMPRSASVRMAMYIPILPTAAGSLPLHQSFAGRLSSREEPTSTFAIRGP